MPHTTHRPETLAPSSPMPEALCAASTAPEVVRVPARRVLAIDGAAAPGSREFQAAIQAVYSVAYTLKFALKREHRDFKVGALEGRWWADPAPDDPRAAARSTWRWQLRMAVPSSVHADEVAAAIRAASAKKPEAAQVRLIRVPAQTVGRILHVGPYADEARSLAAASEAVLSQGLAPAGPHIEVYLSDPRRVDPSRLRTIVMVETA